MRALVLRLWRIGLLGITIGMTLTSCLSPAVSSQVPNSPGKLRVEIIVQQRSSASSFAVLAVKFFDAHNNFIEFAAGETIACNGTFLAFHDDAFLGLHVDSYTGQIAVPPVGANYTCVYHIPDGTKATVIVPSQRPLVLASPMNGARMAIPRTTHTLFMAYAPANGHAISGSAQDSQGHEVFGKSEPDSGHYTLDDAALSTFAPGAGVISLTREWTFAPPGTGFQSVDVKYDFISTVQVTWV